MQGRLVREGFRLGHGEEAAARVARAGGGEVQGEEGGCGRRRWLPAGKAGVALDGLGVGGAG